MNTSDLPNTSYIEYLRPCQVRYIPACVGKAFCCGLWLHGWQRHSRASEKGTILMWGFPIIRGTILGVPIIRIIVYWGLYTILIVPLK